MSRAYTTKKRTIRSLQLHRYTIVFCSLQLQRYAIAFYRLGCSVTFRDHLVDPRLMTISG